MKIAIIDSGVELNHPRLKGASISGISILKDKSLGWVVQVNEQDTLGHGTACAYIIHKHIPEAKLIGIKILDKDYYAKEDALIYALEWVHAQKDIRLVNISMGSNGMVNDRLSSLCGQLQKEGIILVAACNNNINKINYPAAFPSVLGVYGGKVNKNNVFGITPDGFFVAKGSMQRVATAGGKDLIVSGTSYATAHLTGIIANIIEDKVYDPAELQELLKKYATPGIKPIQFNSQMSNLKKIALFNEAEETLLRDRLTPSRKLEWIKRIATFPCNEKEMKHFSEHPSVALFPIAYEIEYPKFPLTDKKSHSQSHLMTLPTQDQFDNFDTLVVGYYLDAEWEHNIDFGNRLVDESIRQQKNFFVLDKRVKKYIESRAEDLCITQPIRIYCPEVNAADFDTFYNSQFLPPISRPVLMVIGTSSRQGKFTVQLRLKQIMERAGYKVGFVASEPHGELFAANFTLPCGHKNAVELKSNELVAFIRNVYKSISYYINPDLIIAGTQSAFMPHDPLNSIISNGVLDSIAHVYGALPDLLVCTIDPYDSIDMIRKMVFVASHYSGGELIFFCITPWTHDIQGRHRKLSEEELKMQIRHYSQELKKPVFDIMQIGCEDTILEIIERKCS